MKTVKREQMIIALLESRGELSVNELSSILDISVSTLRKQLSSMQANGLIIRTYGGVMAVNRVPDETFESKLHKNVAEKRRIAKKARALCRPGASISLGSGTTVYSLGHLLSDLSVGNIYTNSMQVADYLSSCPGLEVHICSGIIRSHTGTIIGSEASDYFRSMRQVDYAFVGCDAINSNGDVFSDNLSVASVEKTLLLNARHKYILCDSSKLGKSSVAHITNLEVCDGLITCPSGNSEAELLKYLANTIYA